MHPIIFNMLFLNYLYDKQPNTTIANSTVKESTDERACYQIYSQWNCFALDEKWRSGPQLLAKLPQDPKEIGATMYYYSTNATEETIIHPERMSSLTKSPIKKNKRIILLAHGFLSSRRSRWIKGILGELTRSGEENIIVVDWNKGAKPPYTQAMANLRVVGVQIAYLIYSLMTLHKVPSSSFHLIGHSLGAHMMGICGSHMKRAYDVVLPRITGLDPAGPLFNGSHPDARLDPTDAEFVDVVHTDDSLILGFPLSVGMQMPIGHVDFYPNGGGAQPYCEGDIRCQHYRASQLFIESIRQSCSFTGIECESFSKFLQGHCWDCSNHNCATMGFNTDNQVEKAGQKYFLLTNGESPFCGSHFRVVLETSNSTESRDLGGEFASVSVRFHSLRSSTAFIKLNESSTFYEPGTVYSKVILTPDIGEITSLSLKFESVGYFFNPIFWRMRESSIHLTSLSVEQLIPKRRLEFCFGNSSIEFDQIFELKKKDLC